MSEGTVFGIDIKPEIEENALEQLNELVKKQREVESLIDRGEIYIKEKKRELEQIAREQIPAILNKYGLSELRLATGEKVIVKDKTKASIKVTDRVLAYQNMIKAEGDNEIARIKVDSLFKSKIVIESMDNGITEILLKNGIPYDTDRTIHAQTLNKYCKERLEMGKSIPEGIAVFQFQQTQIK